VMGAMWLLVRNDANKQKPLKPINSNGFGDKDLLSS